MFRLSRVFAKVVLFSRRAHVRYKKQHVCDPIVDRIAFLERENSSGRKSQTRGGDAYGLLVRTRRISRLDKLNEIA